MNGGSVTTHSTRFVARMPLLAATLFFAACGSSGAVAIASPSAATSSAATPSVAPSPAASAAATSSAAAATASAVVSTTPKTWTVGSASKATVSVREQLVGVSLPSDAVLTVGGGAGAFTLNADGTFAADSKITFDLTKLASDSRDRDNFVKQDTLNTRQFPKAEFVPTKTTGLTLPAAGTFSFKLIGNLTIHGKTKEVTFDVNATRSGGELKAT